MGEVLDLGVQDEKTVQRFVEAYSKLCQEYGYVIVVKPGWRLSSETNDYRMVLETTVQPLQRQGTNGRA
jgi:hypothetical protein